MVLGAKSAIIGLPICLLVLRTAYIKLSGYDVEEETWPSADDIVAHVPLLKELADTSDEFFGNELQFIKVTESVEVAFGASYVNTIIIYAPEGLIIVDTMEGKETAKTVMEKLRQKTSQPIKALIYTHFHTDHNQGTEAFIEDQANPPDIWAFHTLGSHFYSVLVPGRKVGYGVVHQLGLALGPASVAPPIPHGMSVDSQILPNRLVKNETETVTIAGRKVTFLHVPGETDDHLVVWLDDEKVLLPGDNIYPSFPNVYAIRGTPQRDILQWAAGILQIRTLGAEHLVPSHSIPVSGKAEVANLLTVYASAMQYVHDQTVRRMNELIHPDEIVDLVRLPPQLAQHSHLRNFYGNVEWTVKSVYQGYVGWFSGDVVDLQPLTPSQRSQRMVELVGASRLLDEAGQALVRRDLKWALELSSHVQRAHPDLRRAKDIRVQALQSLSSLQINMGARNFYLTAALGTFGRLNFPQKSAVAHKANIKVLFDVMKVRLKAEMTHEVNVTFELYFTDSKRTFRLQLEYSVLAVDEVSGGCPDGEQTTSKMTVTSTERIWKAVMFGIVPAASAFNNGQIKVDSDQTLQELRLFLSYF